MRERWKRKDTGEGKRKGRCKRRRESDVRKNNYRNEDGGKVEKERCEE